MEQGRNDRLGAIWIQADLSGAGRVHDYGKRIWRACLRGVAKNSHVKLKEICLCEVAGGMMRTRYQLILVGIKVSFKCCLRKMAIGKFVCLIGREECCFRSHTNKSLHNYHYGTIKSIGIPMVRSYLLDKGLYEDVLVPNSVSAGIKTKTEIPIWEMEERILASGLTHRLRLCLFPDLVMLMPCLQVKARLGS